MKPDEAFARFIRDWAAFIERWTKRLAAQGHGSSADADDLRQAALIAAWEGYCAWQKLPEEERDPRLLPLMIPRKIKDAMLKERDRVRDTRAAGVTATLLKNYVRTVLAPAANKLGYVEGRLEAMSHTLTALHFIVLGLSQGSTAQNTSAERALLLDEVRYRMVFAMARLSDEQLTLIDGYYFHGRQLQEIGAELGKSPQALTRLHHAALDVLRKEMEEFASDITGRRRDPSPDDDPLGGTSPA